MKHYGTRYIIIGAPGGLIGEKEIEIGDRIPILQGGEETGRIARVNEGAIYLPLAAVESRLAEPGFLYQIIEREESGIVRSIPFLPREKGCNQEFHKIIRRLKRPAILIDRDFYMGNNVEMITHSKRRKSRYISTGPYTISLSKRPEFTLMKERILGE